MVSFISPNLLELKKIEDLTHLGYKKPTNFIRENSQNPQDLLSDLKLETLETTPKECHVPREIVPF